MLCELPKYTECKCDVHKSRAYKPLTHLLLDCWQREYDKRPYKNFRISKTFFEERMRRKFSDDDWTVLIEFLQNRKPKSFEICNIEMPLSTNVQLLESFVKGLEEAETIQLKNISISVTFLSKFQKNIAVSKVRNLDLSNNHLTSEHLILVQCILIQSVTLKSLNVDNCCINENTFAILANGIHKSKNIESIDISRPCPMSTVSVFENKKFVYTMAQLVWQNKLTRLIIRHCNLNGHDIEVLSEYLATKSSKLIEINLQSNNIGSHGTENLFNALTKSKTLQILNLGANNLGSSGGVVVARLIPFTSITSLDITNNKIGSGAMYDLISAIKQPCELKALKVYGNKFNSKVASVVKRLLKAGVLCENSIDCTYTWDYSNNSLCIIPLIKSIHQNVLNKTES